MSASAGRISASCWRVRNRRLCVLAAIRMRWLASSVSSFDPGRYLEARAREKSTEQWTGHDSRCHGHYHQHGENVLRNEAQIATPSETDVSAPNSKLDLHARIKAVPTRCLGAGLASRADAAAPPSDARGALAAPEQCDHRAGSLRAVPGCRAPRIQVFPSVFP